MAAGFGSAASTPSDPGHAGSGSGGGSDSGADGQVLAPEPFPGVRLLFSLDPGTSHLNNGSFGAVPVPVARARQRLLDEMEHNPLRFFADGLDERLAHARGHLARFLGADPAGSALVNNVTTGTSVVLNSLDLRAGDEIVTTNHGYGAVNLAVGEACRRTGAVHTVVRLPLAPTDDEVVDAVVASTTDRTRLVIIDQITSPTARLFPVARVAAALRDHPTAVHIDAAHVPGSVPVDVSQLGADFWTGNLHKWVFAPRGTALLAVAPQWRSRIRPLVVSWEHEQGFPLNVEWQGTRDYTAWLAAPTGLYVLRTLGESQVYAHNAALARYAQQVVGAALRLGPAELPDHGRTTAVPMRLVRLPEGMATDRPAARALVRRISVELGCDVAVNAWEGRGLLRLSAQVYNRAEEYERLAEALPTLLRS